jgi:hypothetical protein
MSEASTTDNHEPDNAALAQALREAMRRIERLEKIVNGTYLADPVESAGGSDMGGFVELVGLPTCVPP